MIAKQVIAALASLALVEQAFGSNAAHRHMHDKRVAAAKVTTKTKYVTEWVTVTKYRGEPAAATTLATAVAPAPSPKEEVSKPEPKPDPKPEVDSKKSNQVDNSGGSNTPSTPPSSSSNGKKRGLAYNDAGLVNQFSSCKKCGWAYNWDSVDNGLSQSGLEFVPMLWGPIDIHTSRWKQNADKMIASGSTHVFSFNECDIASQCNLNARSAADAHIQHMNPYKGKVQIGAPAVTNSNIGGQGLDWLRDWVSACNGRCAFDFCNVHWYSPLEAADTLFEHIKEASKICDGKPIWLTEFAPLSDDVNQVSSWLSTNLPKLDALKELERYSYFMVMDGKLTTSGSLNKAGQTYVNA